MQRICRAVAKRTCEKPEQLEISRLGLAADLIVKLRDVTREGVSRN